jgi:hypothetical protein
LNAIADGLADLMAKTARRDDADGLETDMRELRAAVGLEQRESTARKKSDHDSAALN